MDAASHLVLLPGLDGTGELFAPLLQALGDGFPTSVPPAIIRARLACLAATDVRPLLPRIETPVLYLRASNDRIVSSRLSLELTSLLPNVKVAAIDGPHLLLQARPRECATAIAEFVQAWTRPVTGGASASPSSTAR